MKQKLTPAEKMRRHRAKVKADSEAHTAYLERERARWKRRKKDGKTKQIKDLSEREQR